MPARRQCDLSDESDLSDLSDPSDRCNGCRLPPEGSNTFGGVTGFGALQEDHLDP